MTSCKRIYIDDIMVDAYVLNFVSLLLFLVSFRLCVTPILYLHYNIGFTLLDNYI